MGSASSCFAVWGFEVRTFEFVFGFRKKKERGKKTLTLNFFPQTKATIPEHLYSPPPLLTFPHPNHHVSSKVMSTAG